MVTGLNKLKITGCLILTLITLSLLTANLVLANPHFDPPPTITINADGSLEPSNISLVRNGNTYNFTSDIEGYIIVIKCDNIVLDGKGYKLIGNSSRSAQLVPAIKLEADWVNGDVVGRSNIEIKNIKYQQINGFEAAAISNCNITSNTFRGSIDISAKSNNIRVINNDFSGAYLWLWANNSLIAGNKFAYTAKAIDMFECKGDIITGNTFVNVTTPIEMLPQYNKAWNTNTISPNIILSQVDPTPTPTQQPTNQTRTSTENSSMKIALIALGCIAATVTVCIASVIAYRKHFRR